MVRNIILTAVLWTLLAALLMASSITSLPAKAEDEQQPSLPAKAEDEQQPSLPLVPVAVNAIDMDPLIPFKLTEQRCAKIGEPCGVSEHCCSKRCLTYAAKCAS